MIVVANGGVKTGSTWLYKIVEHLTGFERVPNRFQRDDWTSSSFTINDLSDLVDFAIANGSSYYAKSHFDKPSERDALLDKNPIVRVCLMSRDPADLIVSGYYHHQRHGRVSSDTSFEDFFWSAQAPSARSMLAGIRRYEKCWRGASNVYWTSYEELHDNLRQQVGKIAKFLDVDLTAERLNTVESATKFGNVRSGPGEHVRKGQVGDSLNHLTSAMFEFIRDQLEGEGDG